MTNDRFRDSVILDFGSLDIETEYELDILMRRPKTAYRTTVGETEDIHDAIHYKEKGFHVRKKGNKYTYRQPLPVSQRQLDGAWDWLKSKEYKTSKKYVKPKTKVQSISRYKRKTIVFRDKKTGRFTKQNI